MDRNKDKKMKKDKHRHESRDRDYDYKRKKKSKHSRYSSEESPVRRKRKSRSRSPVQRKRSRSPSPSRHKKHYSRKRSKSPREKRKKQRSKSSSSSDNDSDSTHFTRKISKMNKQKVDDFVKIKEERKQQKEILKAVETPEEKRARRLAKKEAKERRRKQKMGWDKDYLGYTNADNPFGDEHLLDAFVWNKKMEKEHMDHDEIRKHQRKKLEESRRELEKVKKRRLEREREMEERDKEREQLQREKEAEYFREWEKQEDNFHLNQAKLRSKIRIQDGRAKPIDLLAKYIGAEDDDLDTEMHEPYTYLYGLTITDLEDLLEDIKVYLELEEGKNVEYWRDIITISNDELAQLRKLDSSQRDFQDRRERINESVYQEVVSIFKGKTTNQLRLLEEQIKNKLKGGEGVDIGYWESLLQQLKAHMARTRLRERHQEVLRQKLFKLKQEQGIDSGPLFPVGGRQNESGTSTPNSRASPAPFGRKEDSVQETNVVRGKKEFEEPVAGISTPNSGASPAPSGREEDSVQETYVVQVKKEFKEPMAGSSAELAKEKDDDDEDSDEPLITQEDLEEQAYLDYEAGKYSPKLLRNSELDIDSVVYDPTDDMRKLELARQQVKVTGRVRLDGETEFEKKAREGMNDEEATFGVEVQLEHQAFLWSDKYRPRKPRFFNRVHTGFEWNKYNQTHYDIDNPPPKIVQGYKFNIFYPDLIDKAQTPEYTLTPCDDDKDFAVLKFHAGPPYEDIAFKIVNREWEYSYKKGFRCQFQNNIFQLWFHFKRYRYRR